MTRICSLLLALCFLAWSANGLAENARSQGQKFVDYSSCELLNGDSIAPCRIAYRTFGKLNKNRSNAVLVPTWFTGTSVEHAYLAAPELIDPEQYFVIIVDALGNGVSSSPSNSERQANGQFPNITITDMVNSQHRLLTETLDISGLHGVVGLSMGAMQAFEWAVRYPNFAEKTVAAIGSPRLPTYDIALWTARNKLMALYRDCECKEVLEAMSAMRMTQQVPEKLTQEVERKEVEAVISTRASATLEKISIGQTWDDQRQAEAMISHNIARDFDNDLQQAALQVKSDFLIIVGTDDRVVTPQPARDFANMIDAQFIELDEDCGHGEPWCAADEFASLIRGFLSEP